MGEKEVRSLLEKLQPDSIMLDPNQIGNINKTVVHAWMKETEEKKAAAEAEAKKGAKVKKKMRGKSKVGARMKRKHLKEGKEQRAKAQNRAADGGGSGSEDD